MVLFVAVRCFSCKMFQVNQQTKSGKWKCRMCGEGQSIVKVWGRGGHAKDVRGLVMELNAVAGRGEDPQAVLLRGLGQPGSQQPHPHSLSQARDQQDSARGFPSNTSQLRFAQGAEELRSVGPANWARSEGVVPAGVSPGGDGGDVTAVDSWGSAAGGAGQLHFGGERRGRACLENARGGRVGFGTSRENADDAHHHAPAWQQTSIRPPGGGGRGGSRWGVFASDRAAQGSGTHRGPDDQQAEEDPNFVTSLDAAAPPARRGKKRTRYQGTPAEEGGSPSSSSLRSRWALGADREDLSEGASIGAGHVEAREERPWRQNGNKSRRRERDSSSAPLRADQVDEPPTMSCWKGSGGVREDGGCGGGVSRGMFSEEPNGSGGNNSGSGAHFAGGVGARGTGASSSSSRWSKFLR